MQCGAGARAAAAAATTVDAAHARAAASRDPRSLAPPAGDYPYGRGLATGQPAAQTGGAFNSHFDFKQESSEAPKKSRKRRKASEADGKIRKISSFYAQK